MATVLDFSAAFPSAASIKSAGHRGVVCYISPGREAWMGAKPLTAEKVREYRAAGLEIAVVWHYGAGNQRESDVMRGAAGGRADAEAAQKQLSEIGLAAHPVYFAVDFHAATNQQMLNLWNSTIVHYFRAACDVLGRHRVGIYGASHVVHWAMEDRCVAEVAPGRVLGWVTRSWSNGKTGAEYATLYQHTHNVPGPDGVQVDINDVLFTEWGQRPLTAPLPPPKLPGVEKHPGWSGDPTWLPDALRAFGVDVSEEAGWKNRGQGDFLKITAVMAHHTAANNTPTWLIRDGRSDLRGMLSQIHLLRDGKAIVCGQGIAWHAGGGAHKHLPRNAGNWHSIGIEANQDGYGPWPAEQLDAYYRVCAAICWVLDFDADHVVGHKEYSSEGKPDPAPMNMADFRRRVQYYIDNPPFMEEQAQEELMTAFDQIENTYPSRVEGSDVELRPIDALMMADANSFVARANTVTLIGQAREANVRLSRIEALLIAIHGDNIESEAA